MTAWLLTWLLQGIAVAVLVGVGLRASSRLNAATRYVVWGVALCVVAAMALFTVPVTSTPTVEHAPDVIRGSLEHTPVFYVDAVSDSILAIFVGVWAAVALVKLVRLVPGLHAVYSLRDRCRSFPRALELRLDLWREVKGQGRRTELLICDALPGATVLGFHRPCVALPSSLIRALTADDLDQIILHEYAHVQRRDDWARLAQAFVQAVLWVHPAAAMIGRAMNREREMACDEWVVARTGSPKGYATCLTRAAETRARSGRSHALMPALFGAQHELVRRVERLLTNARPRRGVSPAAAATALVRDARGRGSTRIGSTGCRDRRNHRAARFRARPQSPRPASRPAPAGTAVERDFQCVSRGNRTRTPSGSSADRRWGTGC